MWNHSYTLRVLLVSFLALSCVVLQKRETDRQTDRSKVVTSQASSTKDKRRNTDNQGEMNLLVFKSSEEKTLRKENRLQKSMSLIWSLSSIIVWTVNSYCFKTSVWHNWYWFLGKSCPTWLLQRSAVDTK